MTNNIDNPFFSVIVPVHNKEAHIKRSIGSILAQSFTDFELLVINDASTDNSITEIRKIKDSRIRILERKHPGPGGYAARNLGIKKATAKWVCFLDADDEWYADKLLVTHNLINQFPDYVLFAHGRSSSKDGVLAIGPLSINSKFQPPSVKDFSWYVKMAASGKRALHANSVCFNKEALNSFKLFPEGRTNRSGDLYAWVKLVAQIKHLVWLPKVLSVSYRDADNMTSKSQIINLSLFKEMVHELYPTLSYEERKLLERYANRLIWVAWKSNLKLNGPAPSLGKLFYWKNDLFFCFSLMLISLVPASVLARLVNSLVSR